MAIQRKIVSALFKVTKIGFQEFGWLYLLAAKKLGIVSFCGKVNVSGDSLRERESERDLTLTTEAAYVCVVCARVCLSVFFINLLSLFCSWGRGILLNGRLPDPETLTDLLSLSPPHCIKSPPTDPETKEQECLGHL